MPEEAPGGGAIWLRTERRILIDAIGSASADAAGCTCDADGVRTTSPCPTHSDGMRRSDSLPGVPRHLCTCPALLLTWLVRSW